MTCGNTDFFEADGRLWGTAKGFVSDNRKDGPGIRWRFEKCQVAWQEFCTM